MMFPDSLLPKTEKEILKEVSNELNIPYKDVLKTFNIWLDYIEYITKKTDECTIFFPNIGRAYVSKVRLQSADKNTKDLYKSRLEKIENIDNKINQHKVVPISLIYGVGRKNYNIGKDKNDKYQYYTLNELIRRQYELFFKEDAEYRNKDEIYEKFFKNKILKQEHVEYD